MYNKIGCDSALLQAYCPRDYCLALPVSTWPIRGERAKAEVLYGQCALRRTSCSLLAFGGRNRSGGALKKTLTILSFTIIFLASAAGIGWWIYQGKLTIFGDSVVSPDKDISDWLGTGPPPVSIEAVVASGDADNMKGSDYTAANNPNPPSGVIVGQTNENQTETQPTETKKDQVKILPNPIADDENPGSVGISDTLPNIPVTITAPILDKIAPTIKITQPLGGDYLTLSSFKIAGEVKDNNTLSKNIFLFINSRRVQVGEDGSFQAQANLRRGTNLIKVLAIDEGGNRTLVAVEIDRFFWFWSRVK